MAYLTFAGDEYYPHGGMEDYKGVRPTIEGARALAEEAGGDWYHIADESTMKIVEKGYIEDVTTYDPYEEKRKAVPADEHGRPINVEGI